MITTENNTLIIRAKRGNKKAREILLSQYQPMIGKIISQFNYNRDDYEDLIQEANVGILQALQEYKLDGRYTFSLFVSIKIQNNIYSYLKRLPIVSVKYKKITPIIVEFIGDVLEIHPPPEADDAMVYELVVQELINEVFTLDDYKRYLISRKYGLFGHLPMTIKTLRTNSNKKFGRKQTEAQVKNTVYRTVNVLRRALKAKGIEGGDIWKIKNKVLTLRKQKNLQRGKRKELNSLKVTIGKMVVGLVSTTINSSRKVFTYRCVGR